MKTGLPVCYGRTRDNSVHRGSIASRVKKRSVSELGGETRLSCSVGGSVDHVRVSDATVKPTGHLLSSRATIDECSQSAGQLTNRCQPSPSSSDRDTTRRLWTVELACEPPIDNIAATMTACRQASQHNHRLFPADCQSVTAFGA